MSNISAASNDFGENDAEDPEEIAKFFPSFLWVVRDFTLRLQDQYGNKMNSREYLEGAL